MLIYHDQYSRFPQITLRFGANGLLALFQFRNYRLKHLQNLFVLKKICKLVTSTLSNLNIKSTFKKKNPLKSNLEQFWSKIETAFNFISELTLNANRNTKKKSPKKWTSLQFYNRNQFKIYAERKKITMKLGVKNTL